MGIEQINLDFCLISLQLALSVYGMAAITVMCLSIGTPKNNKFSICSKWKIYYF